MDVGLLPCDHGMDFDDSLCENSIKSIKTLFLFSTVCNVVRKYFGGQEIKK